VIALDPFSILKPINQFITVSQGRTLRDLVSEYLGLGLGMNEKPSINAQLVPSTMELNDRGFPQYKCRPTAESTPTTLENLLELERAALDEEDLQRAGQSL
jgi:hypothetical protein